jgi:hypothetical protein
MSVSDRTWERLLETEVGNRDHRLYGGAQYHRALREFNLATKCMRLPTVAEDEIANAAGMGDSHDGVNFLHAACTIALEKARVQFEPMLGALERRMKHCMERLCPVTEYMLRENRDRDSMQSFRRTHSEGFDGEGRSKNSVNQAIDISQNPQFRQLMRSIYDKFVQQCSDDVSSLRLWQCMDLIRTS